MLNPIRVAIADDHPVVCQGLRSRLNMANGLNVVAEASTLAEISEITCHHHPHVLVMGIEFPDGCGLMVLPIVRAECPETKILVLTAFSHPYYLTLAKQMRVSGFFPKTAEPDKIVEAIRLSAMGKELWTFDQLMLIRDWHDSYGQAPRHLKPYQQRVIKLLAARRTNEEIAHALDITEKTTRNYVNSGVEILKVEVGLETRAEIVVWAEAGGLMYLID